MAGSQFGLTILVEFPVGTFQIAVGAYDLLGLGVPHDELLIAVLARVELVNVAILAGSTAGLAESNLAQTAYLTHHVGRIVGSNDVNLVVASVRHAQLAIGREFALEHLLIDGRDDRLLHVFFLV